MDDQIRAFYDALAPDYHRLFADWPASVECQAETLGRLVDAELGAGPHGMLDCACGIGTQAIGLAMRGHRVTATDLSPAAVERLRVNAIEAGVRIDTAVADIRTLSRQVEGEFDVVIACDNSLPHLLHLEELAVALAEMAGKLKPGGLLIASTRDYDRLRAERPGTQEPRVFDGTNGRRIAVQVWDWADSGETYLLHQFIIEQRGESWVTDHFEVDYRATTRAELTHAAAEAELTEIAWRSPEETGYYQPILTARKPRKEATT